MKQLLLLLALTVSLAEAQTTVAEPWVRGTVAAQTSTGMYARITSTGGGRLVSVASPLAGVAEIHQMTMDGTTMQMRALPDGIELPAGQAIELKPGGYHVMLMGLKRPLQAGETVPLTLVVRGANGRQETIRIDAQVRALGAPMPMPMHGAGHGPK